MLLVTLRCMTDKYGISKYPVNDVRDILLSRNINLRIRRPEPYMRIVHKSGSGGTVDNIVKIRITDASSHRIEGAGPESLKLRRGHYLIHGREKFPVRIHQHRYVLNGLFLSQKLRSCHLLRFQESSRDSERCHRVIRPPRPAGDRQYNVRPVYLMIRIADPAYDLPLADSHSGLHRDTAGKTGNEYHPAVFQPYEYIPSHISGRNGQILELPGLFKLSEH